MSAITITGWMRAAFPSDRKDAGIPTIIKIWVQEMNKGVKK